MKVILLTSSLYGTAGNHLPYLLQCKCCKVVMVIHNQGEIADKKKYYRQKIRKAFAIGILGALNGIRMRKWFNEDVDKYIRIENLEDLCNRSDIPFHSVKTINSDETRKLFNEAGADLGISLGNGYIGKKVFSIPKYGMINIHHEILPQYQNAQSIIWQIYNGSSYTGYTIHKIDQHIDTGEILYQEKVPIRFKETLADTIAHTSALLLEASATGLVHVLQNFEKLYNNALPQGKGYKYTTPTIWQFRKIYFRFKKLAKWK